MVILVFMLPAGLEPGGRQLELALGLK